MTSGHPGNYTTLTDVTPALLRKVLSVGDPEPAERFLIARIPISEVSLQ